MTFRITCWVPMCNGEGMTSRYDFEAKDVEAAKLVFRNDKRKYKWKPYKERELPRLELVQRINV